MKTRPLSEEERQMYLKGIKIWEEELILQRFIVKNSNLKISEGLKVQFDLDMSKFKTIKRGAIEKISEIQTQIITYKEHLTQGVPTK